MKGVFFIASFLSLLWASQDDPRENEDAAEGEDIRRDLPNITSGNLYPNSAGAASLDALRQNAADLLQRAQPLLQAAQQPYRQLNNNPYRQPINSYSWSNYTSTSIANNSTPYQWGGNGWSSEDDLEEDALVREEELAAFMAAFDQGQFGKAAALLEGDLLDLEEVIDYIVESNVESGLGIIFATKRVRALPSVSDIVRDFGKAQAAYSQLLVTPVDLMPIPLEDWSNVGPFFRHSMHERPRVMAKVLEGHLNIRPDLYNQYPLIQIVISALKHREKRILSAALPLSLFAVPAVQTYLMSYACINGNMMLIEALMEAKRAALTPDHLALAIFSGSTELIQLLLDSDLCSPDWDIRLTLYWALARGSANMLGVVFGHPKVQGKLPPWDTYCDGLAMMVADGHEEAFEWALTFLAADHNFGFKDHALFNIAAGHGRLGIVKGLLRHSYHDPRVVPDLQALMFALFSEHLDLVPHLVTCSLYSTIEDYAGPQSPLETVVALHALGDTPFLPMYATRLKAAKPKEWSMLLALLTTVTMDSTEVLLKAFQDSRLVDWKVYPHGLKNAILGRNLASLFYLLLNVQVNATEPFSLVDAILALLQNRQSSSEAMTILTPLLTFRDYQHGYDALVLAAVVGDPMCLGVLLDSVPTVDPMAASLALAWAQYLGHPAEVVEALEAVDGVNLAFGLLGAALAGRKEVVEALIAKGVTPGDVALTPYHLDANSILTIADRPLPMVQYVGLMAATSPQLGAELQAVFTALGGTPADQVDPSSLTYGPLVAVDLTAEETVEVMDLTS